MKGWIQEYISMCRWKFDSIIAIFPFYRFQSATMPKLYMTKHLRGIYLLLFLYSFTTLSVKAQNSFGSEDELKKQAQKLFDEEEFEKAYPLYTQLTSLYPKDPVYNYRLGVCMIYASDDKEKPIPFLEFASKNADAEKEVFFYLAKAYHLNYRFDDAITMYVKYRSVAKPAKLKSLQVDRQIEMCKNGRKLLKNVTDLVVLEKKEVGKAEYFRSYDITSIGGKLLVKPDDPSFKSSMDKKKKEQSIIYLAPDNSQVYFSSYGESDENGKDIYISRKMPTGAWSKPQTLGYPLNTAFDEDYPFLHPNGRVLYFCSKGHNSMGGYDVFKSTMTDAGTWGTPVNMNFPINTPDDDILYVTDKDEKEAYFSSARGSITGKTSVYHIDVNRRPADASIIAGSVVKGKEGQPLDLKITVKNVTDNVILGVYNSNASNGEYKMDLPNGGKFMYTIEAKGMPTQSEVIALPVQYELKPLKQEITYDATGKLKIKNLFDAEPSESNYLYALNYIKEKSRMDVTAANEINKSNDLAKKIAQEKADSIANYKPPAVAEVKVDNSIENNKIIQIAFTDANEDAKEARLLKEQFIIASDLVNQKTKLAEVKEKEGNQTEADQLNKEALFITNIAQKLELNANAKQKEADLSKSYAENLEKEVKTADSPDAALSKLSEQKRQLEILNEKNKEIENIAIVYKSNQENKQKELDDAKLESVDLKQEIADNETLIKGYEGDIDKTNKKDVKEGLQNQITALKQENTDKQKELAQNDSKIARIEKEYESAKNESNLIATVVDKAASSAGTNAPITSSSTSSETTNTSNVSNTSANNNSSEAALMETPPMLKALDAKYSSELAKTSTIDDEAQKEKAKADVLENWAKAIDAEIITKKTEFINTSDDARKKQLTTEIVNSEKIAKQKRDAAFVSNQKAKSLGYTAPAVATNTTNTQNKNNSTENNNNTNPRTNAVNSATNNTNTSTTLEDKSNSSTTANTTSTAPVVTLSEYNTKYAEELKSADSNENQVEKETKKYQIYNNWINSINTEIVAKKKELDKTTDSQKRTEKLTEIAALQNDLSDKESIAEALATNVESLKEQQALTTNANTTSPENTNASTNNTTASNNTIVDTANTKTATNNTTASNNTSVDTANSKTATTTIVNNNTSSTITPVETNTTKPVATNTTNPKSSNANTANTSTNNAGNTTPSVETTNNSTTTSTNTVQLTATSKIRGSIIPQANLGAINVVEKKSASKASLKEANDLLNQSNELKAKAATTENAEEKNKILAEAETLTTQAEKKQIESATFDAEANTAMFSYNFYTLEAIAKSNTTPDNDDISKAELMMGESNTYFEKAKKLREDAAKEAVFYNKNALLIEAKNSEELAIRKQEEAFTIYKKYNPNFVASSTTVASANKTTNTGTANNNASSSNSSTNTLPTSNALSGIVLGPDEKFERRNTPAYSASNPIPIDVQLPEGLVFKVQIGAFKNAIPQDLFEGITPITGESTPSGFTRYTAGFFKKFTSANNAKGEVQRVGYRDAFVVAFFNGKRISLAEAVAKTGESMPIATNTNLGTTDNNSTSAVTSNTSGNNAGNTTSNTSSNNAIAKSEKIEQVAGLFYTIQVGVYSQAVSPNKIFNIQPLYTETTPTGNLRYTTGMYNNVNRAIEAKNVVVNIGVRDAFVAAYNKGKRVTLTEAMQLEGQGASVLATSPNINKFPSQDRNATTANTPTTTNTNNNQPTPTNSGNVNVAFKVQIGAFKEEVPLDMVNKFLSISNKGIKNYKDASGLTIYTLGDFKTYEEATKLKNEAVAASISGAFVVAYNNGVKISVEEAKQLIK